MFYITQRPIPFYFFPSFRFTETTPLYSQTLLPHNKNNPSFSPFSPNPRIANTDPHRFPSNSQPFLPIPNTVDHTRGLSNTHKKSSVFVSWVPFFPSFLLGIGMLGTGLNFGRARGEDRFFSPAKARRPFHTMENDKLRRAHSDVTGRDKSVDLGNRVPENRVGSDEEEAKKSGAVPSCEPVLSRLSNLERFLQAITPSVSAQYLPKVCF